MKIPDKVRVLGKTVTVHVGLKDHDLRGNGNFGECDHRDLRIDIRADITHQQQEETLLHEVVHCIEAAVVEGGLPEKTIKSLSSGLYAVMKDNGWWPE